MKNFLVETTAASNKFLVKSRDRFIKKILLQPEVITALNKAARALKDNSQGQYTLVLRPGYVQWSAWRRLCAQVAKWIFSLAFWSDKSAAKSLFGHTHQSVVKAVNSTNLLCLSNSRLNASRIE